MRLDRVYGGMNVHLKNKICYLSRNENRSLSCNAHNVENGHHQTLLHLHKL